MFRRVEMADFKREVRLFLWYYFTNGFTIWFYITFVTSFFVFIPEICGFRTALWGDNLEWVFFVPIVCQLAFPLFNTHHYRSDEFGRWSRNSILPRFTFNVNLILIGLGFTFFLASIMLLIPEDYHQTRKYPATFNDLEIEMFILNQALAIITTVAERSKQYYRDRNLVQETERGIFNLENQISITCVLFSVALSVFVIHDIPFEMHHTYQELNCTGVLHLP